MNIDRVVIINQSEALIVYHDRQPLKLYAQYDIENFVMWFMDPRQVVVRLDDYRKAMALSNEDTSEIEIGVG